VNFITLPDQAPLVTFRIVFRTGAAQDPEGKGGAAWLTAMMLANGGSRSHSYKQILDSLFPMGVAIECQVDQEMIAFCAEVHVDHLQPFYSLLRGMLLEPGWRQDDFDRLSDDAVNYLESELRGQNDEELAKEVLHREIFSGQPCGRCVAGSVSSLRALTIADLREFYLAQFSQDNLTIGLGGGYPQAFEDRVRHDFSTLPLKGKSKSAPPAAPPVSANELLLVEKPARGVAISLGFPITVRRGHPDFPALLLACSALGQHRMSSGRLFTRMRQYRGLNYGDYAYIEHFPGGMYTLEPPVNVARSCPVFQLWIRPVDRELAHFALRLALHEMQKFVTEGISEAEFQRARSFLSKYVNLLLKTKSEELAYTIDSDFYGIPPYPSYVREGLAHLTCGQVNQVIQRHLRFDNWKIVAVGEGMDQLREAILSNQVSPMTYNSPKPPEILEEDRLVERRLLAVAPANARVVPVSTIFA
jgi:zinc protease